MSGENDYHSHFRRAGASSSATTIVFGVPYKYLRARGQKVKSFLREWCKFTSICPGPGRQSSSVTMIFNRYVHQSSSTTTILIVTCAKVVV
jgi:hypothetical protein